ncbi:phosphotransferase [Rothia kristinae]|nr:phosphotransferase [Rothia kristinae]
MSPFALMRFRPLIQAVLDQAGVRCAPTEWDVHSNGSAHLVVNAGQRVSVRVAKNHLVGRQVQRRTDLLCALPSDLPFEVPRPLTRVLERGGHVAVGLTWVPGRPREVGPAPARALGRALRAIDAIDPAPLAAMLEPSQSHWGGSHWPRTVRERIIPQLLHGNRERAERLLDDALALDPVTPRFIHSDFAGHNILWNRERISGVIDWDHASVGDPGWDIAAAGNWFGWEAVTRVVGRDWAERGRVLQRLMPLQAVGYAMTHGYGGATLRQAVERADRWIEAEA